jgi:hypothetical protein
MYEKPLSLLNIFNFHHWPLGRGYELGTPHSSGHRLKNRENETDTEVDTLFISRK